MYIYIGAVEYYHYNDFLDAVEAYELDLEDNRIKAASDIVKKVGIDFIISDYTNNFIVFKRNLLKYLLSFMYFYIIIFTIKVPHET